MSVGNFCLEELPCLMAAQVSPCPHWSCSGLPGSGLLLPWGRSSPTAALLAPRPCRRCWGFQTPGLIAPGELPRSAAVPTLPGQKGKDRAHPLAAQGPAPCHRCVAGSPCWPCCCRLLPHAPFCRGVSPHPPEVSPVPLSGTLLAQSGLSYGNICDAGTMQGDDPYSS